MMERMVVETMSRDDDFVAFKIAVGLVAREEEFIKVFLDNHSALSGNLFPVLERRVIWESHLAQA